MSAKREKEKRREQNPDYRHRLEHDRWLRSRPNIFHFARYIRWRSLDEHRTVRYNWGNDESRSGLLDLLLFLLPFLGYKTHCEFV